MRKLSQFFIHSPVVVLFDLLIIHFGYLAVFYLRWGSHVAEVSSFEAYVHVAPYLSVAALGIMYAGNLYTNWVRRRRREVVYSTAVSAILLTLSTMAIVFWDRHFSFPRGVIVGAGLLHCIMLCIYRTSLQSWYLSGPGRQRVMLVAEDEETAHSTLRKLEENGPDWLCFVGYQLGEEFESLRDQQKDFDTVLLAPRLPNEASIIKQCGRWRKHVMVVPAVLELSMYGAQPIEIDDILMLAVHAPHLSPGAWMVKRICDLIVSFVVLVLATPIMAITAVLIRMTSKGPAIFKQDRVGQDGKQYTLYKFRTMVADAEKETGPVLASEMDDRITPLGRWLRATRIDELPQLFNVLKGDMSIVGPRPERAFFVDQYLESVPGYELRFSVKPGITGLAQVGGGYSTTVERKLRFDLMYIFDYSLLLDIQILIRTVLVILNRKQAEGVAQTSYSSVLAEEDQ